VDENRTYRIFVDESQLDKFDDPEGKEFVEILIDEESREQFQAKVAVSRSPGEGYDSLLLQGRGGFIEGDWFVRVLERVEDEEEGVTVFESMKLGDRRGYMLRSMMAESQDRIKKTKEIMTTELDKRLEKKRKVVEDLLNKGKNPK